MSTTMISSNNNSSIDSSNSNEDNGDKFVVDRMSANSNYHDNKYENFVSNSNNKYEHGDSSSPRRHQQQQESYKKFRNSLALRINNPQRYSQQSIAGSYSLGGESHSGSIARRSIGGGFGGSSAASYCTSTMTLKNYDFGIQRSLYGSGGVGSSHHITTSSSNKIKNDSDSDSSSMSYWNSNISPRDNGSSNKNSSPSFFLPKSLPSPPSLRNMRKQQDYSHRSIFPMTSPSRKKNNRLHVSPPPLIPSLPSPRRNNKNNKNSHDKLLTKTSSPYKIQSSPGSLTSVRSNYSTDDQDENIEISHLNSMASLQDPLLQSKNSPNRSSSSSAFVTFDDCFFVCAYGTKRGSIVVTKTHLYFCFNPPFLVQELDDYIDALDHPSQQLEDIFFHDDDPLPTLHETSEEPETRTETTIEDLFLEEPYEEMMNKSLIRATCERARRNLKELDEHAQNAIYQNANNTNATSTSHDSYSSSNTSTTQPLSGCDGLRWPISQILEIHPRTCMMRDVALEIFFQSPSESNNDGNNNDTSMDNHTTTTSPLPKQSAFFAIAEVNPSNYITTTYTNNEKVDDNNEFDSDYDAPTQQNKPRRQIFVDMLKQYATNLNLTYWINTSRNYYNDYDYQPGSANAYSQQQDQSLDNQQTSSSTQQSYNHILSYPKNVINNQSQTFSSPQKNSTIPNKDTNNSTKRRNWFFRRKNLADNNKMSNNHPMNKALNELTTAWTKGTLSNYDYLLRLNAMAGRTFHDPGNYPIMPWVLSNYTSATVPDLSDERNFRDLTKPMGALCPKRLQRFIDKYNYLCTSSTEASSTPPFMYGSHYSSTGGVVLHYLVRITPFAHLHRQLQGGHFDVPDRLFKSIQQTWEMCSSTSPTEVKELSPEWYSDPTFLINQQQYNLGKTVDGQQISDVILPPWAENSPEKFIEVMKNAIESDICSASLPAWIDLIFGFKQKGVEAQKANNLFCHFTYYEPNDLAKIEDENLREEIENHLADFGHCPLQLFDYEHPQRKPDSVVTQSKGELRMLVASSPETNLQSPRRKFY